jgi:hypothetical protein
MPTNRGRNKTRLERLAEHVLISANFTPMQIKEWFDEHYDVSGATNRREYSEGTHDLISRGRANRIDDDPKVQEFLKEKIEVSVKPVPIGKGGY